MTKKIYYDDSCRLCRVAARNVRTNDNVELIAVSKEGPVGVPREALMYELHAVDDSGKTFAGIDALIEILRWDPRRRSLARLLSVPIVKQLAGAAYWLLARIRHVL